jgi:hypothetical protein
MLDDVPKADSIDLLIELQVQIVPGAHIESEALTGLSRRELRDIAAGYLPKATFCLAKEVAICGSHLPQGRRLRTITVDIVEPPAKILAERRLFEGIVEVFPASEIAVVVERDELLGRKAGIGTAMGTFRASEQCLEVRLER